MTTSAVKIRVSMTRTTAEMATGLVEREEVEKERWRRKWWTTLRRCVASVTKNAEKRPAGERRLEVVRNMKEWAMSERIAIRMTERIPRRKSSKCVISRWKMDVIGKSARRNWSWPTMYFPGWYSSGTKVKFFGGIGSFRAWFAMEKSGK